MLFPENPNKRVGLWESFAEQLANQVMCFLITNGVGQPTILAKILTRPEIDELLLRMHKADICRISVSRGKAIAPHFSAIFDQGIGSVTELITILPNALETITETQLRLDLETTVINLLYTNPTLHTVVVPLHIPMWDIKDVNIQSNDYGLEFRKTS